MAKGGGPPLPLPWLGIEWRDRHSSASAQPVKLVITVNRDVIAVVITVEQSRQPARVNKAVPASLTRNPRKFQS